MPGRAEYGLLAGLGQGLAQVGQMAYADHLQKMRDDRLAKISAAAADGKFARDKELLGMETANRREELGIRNENELGLVDARANADVRSKKEMADYFVSKGLGPDGKATKDRAWKAIKSKDYQDNEVISGISNGSRFIDFSSEYGMAVKTLLDKGADADTAIAKASDWLALKGGSGGNEGADTGGKDGAGAAPPARGGEFKGRETQQGPGYLERARGAVTDFWMMTDPLMLRSKSTAPQEPRSTDPRFKALQDHLNNPDPSQRRVTNQQARNF